MGEGSKEAAVRMREYRTRKHMLARAMRKARRAGNFEAWDSLDRAAKRDGVQVGGAENVENIRQKVLGDMAFDRRHAMDIADGRRRRRMIEIAAGNREAPKVGEPREEQAPIVQPPDEDPAERAQEFQNIPAYSPGFFGDMGEEDDDYVGELPPTIPTRA